MSIKIENVEVVGWEHAIRGMRNPLNSHSRMDSIKVDHDTECDDNYFNNCYLGEQDKCDLCYQTTEAGMILGKNDHKLMMNLAKGGPVHAKYRRMIVVYVDIIAPLYWWKEFDTYKIGTVANSCSTMHKIHDKEFTREDFSCEHLISDRTLCWKNDIIAGPESVSTPLDILDITIDALNTYREAYLVATKTEEETGLSAKDIWWQMIQLLPNSYNQKRTVMLNYEVLHNIYISRKDHKLDEWHVFCDFIESLPYSEIITQPVCSPDKDLLDKILAGEISVNEARKNRGLEPLPEIKPVRSFEVCDNCGGRGTITVSRYGGQVYAMCPICHGEKVVRVNPEVEE